MRTVLLSLFLAVACCSPCLSADSPGLTKEQEKFARKKAETKDRVEDLKTRMREKDGEKKEKPRVSYRAILFGNGKKHTPPPAARRIDENPPAPSAQQWNEPREKKRFVERISPFGRDAFWRRK